VGKTLNKTVILAPMKYIVLDQTMCRKASLKRNLNYCQNPIIRATQYGVERQSGATKPEIIIL
jgi:hypothetical protein